MKQEKQEQKHNMCKTKNQQDFIAKMKQKRNKIVTQKTYSRLMLNRLKNN
jgi:hypothetical protein